MKRLFHTGTVVAGTLLLVACGGGGSGSGNGDESEQASLETKLSLDTNNYANKTVAISAETDIDRVAQLYADLNEGFELINELDDELLSPTSGTPGTHACPGGGTTTLNMSISASEVDRGWTFDDCVVSVASYGSVLFNGRYREVDTLKEETASSSEWVSYEDYDITGKLQNTGETFSVKGRFDWHDFYTSDGGDESYRGVYEVDSLEIAIGERYVAIVNQKSIQNEREYDVTIDFSNHLIGSAIGGYIQVSTPTPLVYPTFDDCPTDGIVRIQSNGVAAFRYGVSASGTANAMAIWLNNQLVASYDNCSDIVFSPVK